MSSGNDEVRETAVSAGTACSPQCEVCGSQSAEWVRDYYRISKTSQVGFTYEPERVTHAFCDEHRRDPVMAELDFLYS